MTILARGSAPQGDRFGLTKRSDSPRLAPSTALRAVPLPRFAGENKPAATVKSAILPCKAGEVDHTTNGGKLPPPPGHGRMACDEA
jgi:hypothetical protein